MKKLRGRPTLLGEKGIWPKWQNIVLNLAGRKLELIQPLIIVVRVFI